jgi:hypothetical protein
VMFFSNFFLYFSQKKMQSSVTIYSVNCDERTIVEALVSLLKFLLFLKM